ncbi:MAG: class I SAM-dependent methyltransferase [Pseudomonadota bacterium]|nr:class I SAM-dependent methyltransferase [Pseudomonadota bacterium]
MPIQDRDPKVRFSDRVENYRHYRPHYPAEVLEILRQRTGLAPESVIADVGSGTGISAELFLRAGHAVWAVEPNEPMRRAAEEALSSWPGFHSIAAQAEATTLPNHSVNYVVAAQAFHWFEAAAARQEFKRILTPHGWVVLLWNTRSGAVTPFLTDYEQLLRRFGTDYHKVRRRNVDDAVIEAFFPQGFERHQLANQQVFDFEALKGRVLSSSYVPTEGDPRFEPMLAELKALFNRHQHGGRVTFLYDTELYFGTIES